MDALLPPHAQLTDFLARSDHGTMLDWVLDNERRFSPATVRSGNAGVLNPELRVALTCPVSGPLKTLLQGRLLEALPMLMQRIGATGPEPRKLELEFAAHGDGAFYGPHTDMPIGPRRKLRTIDDDRVISAVLYFHSEPKGFAGGQLRLYGFGVDPDVATEGYVDVQPLQNSLVVFHSWTRHEVRRIECPSREFRDYRFALNIWFRREIGE